MLADIHRNINHKQVVTQNGKKVPYLKTVNINLKSNKIFDG